MSKLDSFLKPYNPVLWKPAKPSTSITTQGPPYSWRKIHAQLDQSISDEAKESHCILLNVASSPVCNLWVKSLRHEIPSNHATYCEGCPWRGGTVKTWNRRQRKLNYRWSEAKCARMVGLQKAGCKTTLTTLPLPCASPSLYHSPKKWACSKLRVEFKWKHICLA